MKGVWVTDRASCGDARFGELLSQLAGAPGLSVQLREKETADRESLAWAETSRGALGRETPLFVNRRLDIALAASADGVHLPAAGLPPGRVRAAAPRGFRVGVSTHSSAEAVRALKEGADLVFIGPIFDTPSKRRYGPPLTPSVLAELPPRSARSGEVYAIGGIGAGNLDALSPYRDFIDGVAAIRFFQDSPDPRAAAESLAGR